MTSLMEVHISGGDNKSPDLLGIPHAIQIPALLGEGFEIGKSMLEFDLLERFCAAPPRRQKLP